MIRIGLTGSIGMGKSTVAAMFGAEGAAIHDADAVVHRLYEGEAVPAVGARFPEAVVDGRIDRGRLAAILAEAPAALADLEAIVHPLVQAAEARLIDRARKEGRDVVALDIPLLLEAGGERRVDAVIVVSAPPEVQRARVLARSGMTEARLQAILARQMPDADKRRRAHFVVDTSRPIEASRRAVADILRALAAGAVAR